MKKNINVLYPVIYHDVWFHIARKAYEEHRWNPVYMVSELKYENKIREIFPDAVFHDRNKAVVGMPSDDHNGMIDIPSIDQDYLKKFKYHESNVLLSFDRFDSNNSFTYRERVYYYHKMLRYWTGVLKHYKPDLVLFPTVPHMGYDYVIYMLCKEMDIKTGMFLEIPLGKLILTENYTDHFPVWDAYKKYIKSNTEVELTAELESYLSNLTGDYKNAVPYFMKPYEVNILNAKYKGMAKYLKRQAKWAVRDIGDFLNNKPRTTDSKLKDKGWNVMITSRDERAYLKYAIRKRKELNKYYLEHVKQFDKNKKYIYIPLQYQPEETSCPRGEVYAHQYLLLDIVSKCIPNDWKLYVKEHPLQFNSMLKAIRSRDLFDYEHMLDIPKVSFLDPSVPTFELIDNAQAVATMTGTGGWEAVNRGIPVLLFGHPWYKGCEGTFYTPTVKSCKSALKTIMNGYKPDRNKVRLFAGIADKIGVRATDELLTAREFQISDEISAENMLHYIVKTFSKKLK